jgi:transcriptional regulator with XRE-family HTH domain
LAQQTFGNRLAEARRRRGLTLEQVHIQLRISPAILESLEIGDFYHMPLKGHARNMVSAYARYLGLNPEEVTKQFLGEYREFENREDRQSTSSFTPIVTNSGRFEAQPVPPAPTSKRADSQGVRSMWNKPIPRSELSRGYDSRSPAAQRVANAASRRRSRAGVEKPSDSRRQKSDSYTPRQSLPSRVVGSLFGNPIALITVLVFVIIALLVVWAMAANSCKKQGEERNIIASGGAVVNEEAAVGGTDAADAADGTDGAAAGQEDVEDPRYGPFELVVEQAAGTGPWVRITVDGENVYEGTLSERFSREVTEGCTVLTAQPNNVTVTRGGEAASFTSEEDGNYSVTLEVEKKPTGTTGTTDETDATGQANTNQGSQ